MCGLLLVIGDTHGLKTGTYISWYVPINQMRLLTRVYGTYIFIANNDHRNGVCRLARAMHRASMPVHTPQ